MDSHEARPDAVQEGPQRRASPSWATRSSSSSRYAERARRDGLLALEEELESIDDEYLKKGLQLVVDGTDPDLVREILEAEIDGMRARHKEGAEPFEKAGGFAPTMGIIGTVMGLVHVLQNLVQPETLGPSISGAFIATLLGVGAGQRRLPPGRLPPQGAQRRRGRARAT